MKIRFLAERIVRDHEGAVVDHFKPGQVRELSENSARRWIARAIAEEVQGGAKSRRAKKAEAAEEGEDPDPAPAGDDAIMAERKAPRPADPMTHADHPAVAKATGKT